MKVDGKNYAIHEKDVKINKNKLKNILDSKGMGYTDLWDSMCNVYGKESISITYKAFMHLLSNRNTWKLIYAIAITDVLKISIKDVFDIVEVDVEKAIQQRKVWDTKNSNKKRIP